MTVSSKILLNGLKKELPKVKIIEPFQPEIIECENKDEFAQILKADEEKYKEFTTQKLNRIFHVPGYKVTKCKGEICLRSIKNCEKIDDKTEIKEEIKNIKAAFNELSDQLELIKSLIMQKE